MAALRRRANAPAEPASITNGAGRGRLVLACDHASNRIPQGYETLGLDPSAVERHIAWDPGALPVAQAMSRMLDAPLVASNICRLIIDPNRPLDAPDLIPAVSETTRIPANENLDNLERQRRIRIGHEPFHAALADVLDGRAAAGIETWLVSIHSFTPVYKGRTRPWQIGIIHDEDDRLAGPLIAALKANAGLNVGINQPYAPADRVYYTLERHGRARGLPCAMIEIRNDEIPDATGQLKWAELLAGIFRDLAPERGGEETRPGKIGKPARPA